MKTIHIAIAIIAAAMLMTLSPANAKADESDKKTVVTFSQPVEIPGMVLPAGTYVFRRASTTDPNVVEISDKDEKQVYATLLDKWLGVSSKEVLGGEFKAVEVLKA